MRREHKTCCRRSLVLHLGAGPVGEEVVTGMALAQGRGLSQFRASSVRTK